MGCTDQGQQSTAVAPQSPGKRDLELYQPPSIAWEEEFAPIAVSDPICPIEPTNCE